MSDQLHLRRRIATLEVQQQKRIALTAERKKLLDETIDNAQREIDNLRAQLTIGVVE